MSTVCRPVHFFILSASLSSLLSVKGDVVGGDAVAPPQLTGHTPVPDVLQPPAVVTTNVARAVDFTSAAKRILNHNSKSDLPWYR